VIAGRLLALAGALALAACGSEPARDWPAPSPALWQVTSPTGEAGWLFGTIHALPAEVEWRTAALDAALAQAQVVVVEIAALGDRDEAEAAFEAAARSADLPALSERVAPADRADLAAFLDRAGSDDGDFAGIDTWAAAVTLANRSREIDGGQSVDRALMGGAKEIVGLETHASQYAVFDALPAGEQADLLMALARDTGPEAERIEDWLTGDLAALERASAGLLDDPELRAALQTGRNLRWAPIVAGLVEQGRKPFVAVGTAHLFGADSLQAQLEARGYTVRRVQ
jgi:uncharacterized protein YbaP (TraB family)